MKTCGIICELNPAHNGHKYIFDMARQLTDADFIIAIMSGDYVQRGEPAIIDKHIRTKMALMLGANIVIELPGIFATGSAQYFARGAVSILDKLGTDYLVFGSESGDITTLKEIESTTPNDILGSEYIKAIEYFNSSMKPVPVKRIGTDYNDSQNINANIASATYIREHINENLSDIIPGHIYSALVSHKENNGLIEINDFSALLFYKLLSEKDTGLEKYFDVYSDFSDKILKNLNKFTDYTDFCYQLKTKEIAFSHIKRGLLHILLNITNNDLEYVKSHDFIAYLRVLGFASDNPQIFSLLDEKKKNAIPLITRLSDGNKLLDNQAYSIFTKDIAASNLYNYVANSKSDNPHIINELSRPIIKQ